MTTSVNPSVADLLAEAVQLKTAGFQIVAVGRGKAPAHARGFKERPAAEVTDEAIEKIASKKTTGLRLELGARGRRTDSAGLLRIPLAFEWEGRTADNADWARRWQEALDLTGLTKLFEQLDAGVVQATPSGGRRWFFEVVASTPDEIEGLAQSAQWLDAGRAVMMAEILTHDAIVAPSHGAVHPSGKPYLKVRGDWVDLPTLTIADVEALGLVLEMLCDEGVRRGKREPLENITPLARQVRAAYARKATPQDTLELLRGAGWRVLSGELPGEVALVRPGSSSTAAHAHVGGPDRAAGQLSVWTTSDEAIPQGRHSAFDVVALVKHKGQADRAAHELARSTKLPALVLRALERPYVEISDRVDTITVMQGFIDAVAGAESAQDPGQPMVVRQVAKGTGAHVGILIPRRGLPPARIAAARSHGLFVRCAQPIGGWHKVKGPGDEEAYEPILEHTIPQGIREESFRELCEGGALSTVEVVAAEPVLLPSGRVVAESGFYESEGVLVSIPLAQRAWWKAGYAVPDRPTAEQAQKALDYLMSEVFVDFPFVDDGDRAVLIACLLTSVGYNLMASRPGFVTVAPDRGTGKSLGFETIRLIASGSTASIEVNPYKKYDDENAKTIVAGVLAGTRFVGVDNVDTRSRMTSVLATTLLTKPDGSESIRLLGGNEQVAISGLTWMVAGNSIEMGGDLQRRFLNCDLEVAEGLAFERTGFRHPELLRWVAENRPQLLAACHTILAHGLQNPPSSVEDLPFQLAKFEDWCRVVVGSMAAVTINGSNAAGLLRVGRRDFVDSSDAEAEEWGEFLRWFAAVYEVEGQMEAGKVATLLEPLFGLNAAKHGETVDLPEAIEEVMRFAPPRSRPRKLATVMSRIVRTKIPYGDHVYKLVSVKPGAGTASKKSALWSIEVQRRAGTPEPAEIADTVPVEWSNDVLVDIDEEPF